MLTHGASRSVRRMILLITASALIATPQLIALPAQAAEDPGLVTKLNSVLSDSRTRRAKTGAVVLDAKTGELLYSRYGGAVGDAGLQHQDRHRGGGDAHLDADLPLQDLGHPAGRRGGRDPEGSAVPQGLRRSDHPPGRLREAGQAGEDRGHHPCRRQPDRRLELLRSSAVQPGLEDLVRVGLLRGPDLRADRGAELRLRLRHGVREVHPAALAARRPRSPRIRRPPRSTSRSSTTPPPRRGAVPPPSRRTARTGRTRSPSAAGCPSAGRPAVG